MPLSDYAALSEYFHLAGDVHLQGWGEPLLHPRLFDMVRTVKAKGCRVSLTTNGVLLTPEASEELIREGVDIVAVSIAGAVGETHERIRAGSCFEKLIGNIRTLSALRKAAGARTPRIVLSFLMTGTNMEELPDAVGLAGDSGVDEMVATNLDCIPKSAQDELKVFSCDGAEEKFKELIERARRRATKAKITFRAYPLEMDEVLVCELNPLRIAFISYDGCVSPCVYLNMTKKKPISRMFCGSSHEVERLCFGNIREKDFMEVWEGMAYRRFRSAYAKRAELAVRTGMFSPDPADREREERETAKRLSDNPLPGACRTCYKAFGI